MYSLIIVDYNSIDITNEYIARCWETLGKTGAGHVVIVENGSNDGVPEKLEAAFGPGTLCDLPEISQKVYRYGTEQQILYCHSEQNLGYAFGNNLGIRIAHRYFGDAFCIVSNNDVHFEKPFDFSIADQLFAEDPRIALIGPEVLTPAGERQSPNSWQTPFQRLFLFYWKPLLRLFRRKAAPQPEPKTGPCDWIIGCFMLIRTEAMLEAGMFDEHTFLYAEELILSRRLEQRNYTVWYCHELSVIHKHAQTTKKVLSMLQVKRINFNSILYYYKTYCHTSPIVLALAKLNFLIHQSIYFCLQPLKGLKRKTGR